MPISTKKSIQTQLQGILNLHNSLRANLIFPITRSQFLFSEIVETADGTGPLFTFVASPKIESGLYGTSSISFRKINLGDNPAVEVLVTTETALAQLVPLINAASSLALSAEDVVDGPISFVSNTLLLAADPQSLKYLGSLTVTRQPPDQFGSNVAVDLRFGGADGGSSFIDSSPRPKTFTANGAVTTQSTTPMTGAYGEFLGGYLTSAYNAEYALPANYIVEMDVIVTDATNENTLICFDVSSPLRLLISANRLIMQGGIASDLICESAELVWNPGQKYNIRAVRSGNNYGILRDGVLVAFAISAIDYGVMSIGNLYVGINAGLMSPFIGQMDNLRITPNASIYLQSPNVSANVSSYYTLGAQYGVPNISLLTIPFLYIHPGPGGSISGKRPVVRFTVPSAGTYDITFVCDLPSAYDPNNRAEFYRDGTLFWFGPTTGSHTETFSLSLAQGEILDFTINSVGYFSGAKNVEVTLVRGDGTRFNSYQDWIYNGGAQVAPWSYGSSLKANMGLAFVTPVLVASFA